MKKMKKDSRFLPCFQIFCSLLSQSTNNRNAIDVFEKYLEVVYFINFYFVSFHYVNYNF